MSIVHGITLLIIICIEHSFKNLLRFIDNKVNYQLYLMMPILLLLSLLFKALFLIKLKQIKFETN